MIQTLSVKKTLTFLFLSAMAITVLAGDVFYWMPKANVWADFTDSSNWAFSTNATSTTGGRIPGAEDFIWNGNTKGGGAVYAIGSFNLGGASNVVYGFSPGTTPNWGKSTANWTTWHVFLTNGTLDVRNPRYRASGADLNMGHRYHVLDGATLIYSDLEGATYGAFAPSGLGQHWEISAGGSGAMYGYLAFQGTAAYTGGVTVTAGGEFKIDPRGMYTSPNGASGHGVTFENHGTFLAPNGFKLTNSGGASSSVSGTDDFRLEQMAGRMLLGGDFTKLAKNNNIKGNMKFRLSGGTLEITNAVSFRNDPSADNASKGFYDEVSAEMSDNASATVDVKANSSVDMRLFTYGENTSLVKTGPGKMMLKDRPASLAVNEGSVFFTNSIENLNGVTFAVGTTLGFMAANNVISALPNAAMMSFVVDEVFPPGGVVVESADNSLLETISARLQLPASLSGYAKVISGGKLRLMSISDNAFTSEGEVDLGTAANWSGWVPSGGAAHLVGDATVGLLSSATPAFSSITVSDGATLKVTANTDLPAITLVRDAKIVIDTGVWASLSNGLSCTAIESSLPVFEIATNATLAVPAGTQFKNVDLRHYGKIDVQPSAVSADNYVAFGTAANGDTTYFAMTSIGGTVRITTASDKAVRFVHPDAGGRVKVVGKILLKDFTHDAGAINRNGPWFGVNNPVNEPFDVIVDNSDIEIARTAFCNGAARVLFVNGARYVKLSESAGAGARLLLQNDGRVRFESGAGLKYSRSAYPLEVTPSSAGTPSIAVGDGGYVAVHAILGNGKGVFVASNGCWCVDSLPTFTPNGNPCPPDNDARNWVSNAFSGFASVRIDPDSVLYLKSANIFNMTQWNRYTQISDIPMTGSGGLVLTNGVPGYGFAATLVNGSNTATGRLSVAPSDDPTTFFFNDGANWAGTVQGDEHVAFTNITDSAAPATVSFGALELTGAMPIRFWRDANGTITNDMINVSAALSRSANGCIKPVRMSGEPQPGEMIRIGEYPSSAGVLARNFGARKWRPVVVATGDPAVSTLYLRYEPIGITISIK